MPAPRLLVIEGNTADGRALLTAAGGRAPSTGYAELLRDLMPEAVVDICYPADPGANLPGKEGVEGYDGAVITGSALHVYDRGPAYRSADRARQGGARREDAVVRKLLGPAGDHGRGRRQRAEKSERPRDRLRPPHPPHRGRPRASDVCRQGRSVQCGHRASRRGRIGRARARRCCRAISPRRCNRRRSVSARRSPGARNIIPNIRSATSRRPCAATARHWSIRVSSRTKRICSPIPKELDMINVDPTIKWLTWRHALDQVILDKSIRVKEISQLDRASGAPDAREARARVKMKFSGRHVVITGGTGALGSAVVGALLECRRALPCALHSRARSRALSACKKASG